MDLDGITDHEIGVAVLRGLFPADFFYSVHKVSRFWIYLKSAR
jgi:hypothetical protein